MRTTSWIGLGVAAIGCGFYESAFLASAPFPLDIIRPIFPACVMLVLLNRPSAAYVFVAIAGIIADLFAPVSLGFAVARWLLVLVCADAISERIMTNRSLYAATMVVAAFRIMDAIVAWVTSYLAFRFFNRTVEIVAWSTLAETVVVDVVITAAVFLGVTIFTRRFLVSVRTNESHYAP